MHQRFFKLSLLFLALFSLFYFSTTYAKTQLTTLRVPTFSSIDIQGPVKVVLTHQKKQTVTIVAPPEVVQQIHVSVQNRNLFIDAKELKNQPNLVLIKVGIPHHLYNISLRGPACLYLKGNNIQLHSIQNDGSGIVIIKGINTKVVMVRGNGNGRIVLSGRTEELNVQIGGSLLLRAERLRTEVGHILTQDYATAYVHVFGPLHAFAYGASYIYYYYNPSRLVRDTAASGNVLKITPDRRLVPAEDLYWLSTYG